MVVVIYTRHAAGVEQYKCVNVFVLLTIKHAFFKFWSETAMCE